MEDISLRYLDPIAYQEIESALAMKAKNGKPSSIRYKKSRFMTAVSSVIPNVSSGRPVKSINGIYRKVFVQGKSYG